MNLHLFDVKSIKNVELRLNAFKTTQNYKSNQITKTCIDLMSKRSKQLKTTKRSNYNELHRFDVITIKNVELRRNAFKTTQNYKSNQITMTCIDLMSKRSKQRKITNAIKLQWICIDLTSIRSKMLRYVAKHSKQHLTTKVIKLQWLASIWCQNDQNDQNNAKLQMRSNYNEFASIWRQYDQKCWVRRKTFKTTQN